MPSQYFRRVNAINRNQGSNDVERGMSIGQEIGKMMGGLSEAVKGYQKDQLANKLMTAQNISNQPGAGQTIDLGTLPGGPQPNAGGGSGGTNIGPDPDPDPTSVTYPSGGGYSDTAQPTYTEESMPDLSQAVAQTKVANTLQPPTGSSGGDNWNLSNFGGSGTVGEGAFPGGGSGTVGGLIGTGGEQGLKLQQAVAEQKIKSQNAALSQQSAALKLADARAKASGTGPYSMDAALKRAQLLAAQTKSTKTAVDKTSLAASIDTEPVEDQAQLIRTYESTHGKGSYDKAVQALNEPDTIPDPDPAHPGQTIPNPNKPVVSGGSVVLNPVNPKKSFNLQLQDVQTLAKQVNVKRIAQGQSPLAVPGEDPNLGSSRANPIPVKTKLDGARIPHGKWIQTPTGAIIQRP